jgi:hypothetical protein
MSPSSKQRWHSRIAMELPVEIVDGPSIRAKPIGTASASA